MLVQLLTRAAGAVRRHVPGDGTSVDIEQTMYYLLRVVRIAVSGKGSAAATKDGPKCKGCGSTRHGHVDCKSKDLECRDCGRRGHFARVCTAPQVVKDKYRTKLKEEAARVEQRNQRLMETKRSLRELLMKH